MRKLAFVAAVSLLGLHWACDIEKTANQLTAPKVMVATLLSTPPVDIDPLAYAPDSGFDGGLPPDAGFAVDGGLITVPAQTVAFVFFGTRKGEGLDSPPEPISNATVSVQSLGGTRFELKNDGNGNYSKSSVNDRDFKYDSGKTYHFTAALSGESFVGEVENAPNLERISAFHPPKGYVELNAKQQLIFNRPDPPAGTERNLGFVTVFPIGDDGERGETTYTNVPKTPLDFLKLIALPAEWKQTTVTVPGSAFPEPRKTYVVVFQSVKTGGPKSDNLFTGSAILAGTADVAVVRTR